MFFCGAIKLTGPFVTMIFEMVTGDMFTFSIIYCIMLLGFTQAFFFILKSHEEADWFESYHTTWIGDICTEYLLLIISSFRPVSHDAGRIRVFHVWRE